jgi:glucose/arabinose dehydrogenase
MSTTRTVLALAALAAAAPLGAQAVSKECTPIETRPPNATSQQPAFPGQTRICGVTTDTATYAVTVVAKNLQSPWAVEPLPNGDLLVTEKPGRLRVVTAAGKVNPPIAGLPGVDARGQGGLLDVALSPGFANDRTIYWSFAEPRGDGNGTSIARGVLSPDMQRLDQVRVIFRVQPTYNGVQHFGDRIAFGPDGMLYASFGERSDTVMRHWAQQLDSHLGKVIRIAPDGSVPRDNPYAGRQGALGEIWTMGHRNPQGLAFDASGQLWEMEHGTRGGDELNRLEKGKNYGWPDAAYGIEYAGGPIRQGNTQKAGTEQPVYYWDPVIAPSGITFYNGDAFPAWKGNLFVGAMGQKRLVRLVLQNGKVVAEEHLLVDRNQRIRDVRQGPDGALYMVTDADQGELWKLAPRR